MNLEAQISWQAHALGQARSADFVAGTARCEPRSADFVAGTARCEPRSADFVAGAATALCEPGSADFGAGTALCEPPRTDFVAGPAVCALRCSLALSHSHSLSLSLTHQSPLSAYRPLTHTHCLGSLAGITYHQTVWTHLGLRGSYVVVVQLSSCA